MSASRRQALAVLAAGAVALPTLSRAIDAPPRLAALDWGLAATAIRLGVPPIGVAEQRLYGQWVREPAIPAGTVELGLRTAPSLETLAALRPDAILINALNEALRPQLDRIAPTWALPIYTEARRPLDLARAATVELGKRLGRTAEATRLVEETDATLARARNRLGASAGRKVLTFGFVDARHLRVYGSGSLFADVLAALGLADAWEGPTSVWGEALADVAAIAAHPGADLLAIEPLPGEVRRMFGRPGLWSSLVAAGSNRFFMLPPVWAYGELSAAARFAELAGATIAGGKVLGNANG